MSLRHFSKAPSIEALLRCFYNWRCCTNQTLNILLPNRRRYVDYPITDVLQMMGRAGRPQYDRHGVAVIMVGG